MPHEKYTILTFFQSNKLGRENIIDIQATVFKWNWLTIIKKNGKERKRTGSYIPLNDRKMHIIALGERSEHGNDLSCRQKWRSSCGSQLSKQTCYPMRCWLMTYSSPNWLMETWHHLSLGFLHDYRRLKSTLWYSVDASQSCPPARECYNSFAPLIEF